MDRNNKHNHDDNDDDDDDDDENYREQNNPKQLKSSSDDADKLHFNMLLKLIHQVSKGRLLETASFIESMAPVESSNGSNPKIDTLTVHAVNWIRSVVEFSFVDETSPLAFMRVLSENLALMDFLELSIQAYSDAKQGAFEWPVWVGQISVDSYVTGSRMRNTAHVVVTTPMQSPGFLPGCNLIQKRTPSGIFRCEPYNMIPIPPWGRLRALSREDAQILRPVAERLEHQSQVAVPLGYHSDEILDIRVASAARTRQLLASMSWKPRGSWILEDLPDHSSADAVSWSTGLVCVWQEDTMEMRSDRQYLTYVVDLLKAMDRMQQLK
ncbi:hypothetical protein ACA910_018145 [Epithemia clementina (nom. ined.)]